MRKLPTGLAVFGQLLEAHVRFEENELFPACERLLEDAVLERVAERTPKGKAPGYDPGLDAD